MAKPNKSVRFARMLDAIVGSEERVTQDVSGALVHYHRENGNPDLLAYIYTGLEKSEKIREEQSKCIRDFIHAFAGVETKRDIDEKPVYNNGTIVLLKNEERLKKVLNRLEIAEIVTGEDRAKLVQAKINEYLAERGGNIFGKKKTVKAASTETPEETAKKKREALRTTRVKKMVSDMNTSGMSADEKNEVALALIKALGHNTIDEFKAAMNPLMEAVETELQQAA